MMQEFFLLENGVNILYFKSVRWSSMIKSKQYIFWSLFCILLMLIPLRPAKAGEAKEVRGQNVKPDTSQVLRLGLAAASPGTFDPHFAATDNDRAVADMIFNGLLRYKPGKAPFIEPDLAQDIPEPKILKGKQIWTFKLRKGVLFHPGPKSTSYELTADDVIFSFQKASDPKRSAYAGEYSGMTFKKVDKYTVQFILNNPLSSNLFFPKVADYAGGFIVCERAIEIMGQDAFKAHPVGTGPFVFKKYTPGEKLRLVANEQYFRGRPLLDAVDIKYVANNERRSKGLTANELDVIYGLDDAEWIEEMKQREGIVVDVLGPGQVKTVHFNTIAPPLNDVQVRKAIAYALDRDMFLTDFSHDVAVNVYSIVPPQFLPGGLTKEEVQALGLDYAVDLEKARKLLVQAGYSEGFSLDLVASELESYQKPYKSLKVQLARIGIKLNIKIVNHATMHKLIRKDINPIVLYGAWRPNADVYLTRFFHSDSIVVTGKNPDTNFSHYNKIDKLIEAARIEINPGKQIELWKHAQIKIMEDMVAYPLHYLNQNYAHRAHVDYGHELVATMALYPQITEKTRIVK